ncbi:type II toxin-antitoxin system antitoxin DNA ADP-ribosyl glycohydrolase DarG [Streptomyces otsuchiensis]|uniref:type II toxin-antitoxin system antitoxin DNA ADP-ribosyl glycohydrolase DarG n=1 Tax=Streptomyces otsuchiensis TaxID=2681388 RepID=UPI00102FFB4F|nr:macro domain-containing protein [Streptomyces otsuchiensis]
MITESHGNLLRDDAQALVNTVNTVGVMGKGIALQFKRAFPHVFDAYAAACEAGEVRPGVIQPVALPEGRWVLNFPTKRHWRQPSRMEDICAGLDDLVRVVGELKITSVAVPPLGCGNGGLPWSDVRALIIAKLQVLDADIRLYGLGTPPAADMPIATAAPVLNQQRARFLAAMRRYIASAWAAGITEAPKASLLEFHKIAYLLQCAGINLDLRFEAGHYGPYSSGLDRAIAAMEGHQIIGFGDGTGGARADIELRPCAAEDAEKAVSGDTDFEHAWAQVSQVFAGYEYPEGMELLASVHYLATQDAGGPRIPAEVARDLAAWSARKRRLFPAKDASEAWTRLDDTRFFSAAAR